MFTLCTHEPLGAVTAESGPEVVASSSIEARVGAAGIGFMLTIGSPVTIHTVTGMGQASVTAASSILT